MQIQQLDNRLHHNQIHTITVPMNKLKCKGPERVTRIHTDHAVISIPHPILKLFACFIKLNVQQLTYYHVPSTVVP